jgi:hypothetical protein
MLGTSDVSLPVWRSPALVAFGELVWESGIVATLAKSVKSQAAEDIGVPVYRMVKQVKKWLAQGHDVRIFTARVNPYPCRIEATRSRRAIEAWSERDLGQVLPITYEKDWDMASLFDNRARQVEHNTGRVLDGCSRRGAHRNHHCPP